MDLLHRTILDDLAAGESLISLREARNDRRLMLDGRPHEVRWIHRAASSGLRGVTGKRVILETIFQSGRRVTTESAITRFVHHQANGSFDLKPREPSEADHRAVEKRLAAAGL